MKHLAGRIGRDLRGVMAVACIACFTALPTAHAEKLAPPVKPYAESYVGDMGVHHTKYEDTMVKIARDYSLGFNELRAANPNIDPWMPGENVDIVLPTRHILPQVEREGIVINLPEQRLYYFVNPGEPPVTVPLGVGREGLSTPMGSTKVMRKTIGPVWRPTARMRREDPSLPEAIGPGADNPMGTHAMYLGWPEYAIHGTNKPYGIGRRSSSGCIRLYPEDIVTMYELTPEGTKVTVVDQPVKVGWIGNDLYLEAHPTLAQADAVEQDGHVSTYEFSGDEMALLMHEAGGYADLIDWPLVREIMRKRQGVPAVIASKPAVSDAAVLEEEAAPEADRG